MVAFLSQVLVDQLTSKIIGTEFNLAFECIKLSLKNISIRQKQQTRDNLSVLANPHSLEVGVWAQRFLNDENANQKDTTHANAGPCDHVAGCV